MRIERRMLQHMRANIEPQRAYAAFDHGRRLSSTLFDQLLLTLVARNQSVPGPEIGEIAQPGSVRRSLEIALPSLLHESSLL